MCAVSVAALILAAFPSPASAQQDAGPGTEQRDPLAMKQDMIRDRFERFEDRIFRLQELLEKTEPENAQRLARVLERAGELGLQDRLDVISKLLEDPSSLNSAIEAQGDWINQADQLLAILLQRDSDNDQRKREIDRLEEYRKSVDRLLEQERELRDASGDAGQTQGMLQQLDQALERLDALISRQAGVSGQSRQATPGSPEAAEASEQQEEASRDAAQLAEDVDRLAELQPESMPDSEAAQSAQSQTKAAAQSLQAGSKAMSQAAQAMQQGEAGEQQQAQAEQALAEAKEHLEKAKEALQERPSSEELAEKQKQVAEDTGALAEKMQEEGGQQGSQEGQQGQQGGQQGQQGQQGPQSGSQSPGQQSVQQAQQNMQQAGESLQKDSPNEALPKQDQAIEKLEQAKQELQKALEDLRKEERAEALRDLEQRFREMLSKQRGINEKTVQLSDKGEETFGRPEHLQLADLSSDERALSQEAATCLHILEEDATTIVFPSVLEQISVDMATVAKRLAELNVGLLTQRIEQQIVETLEQLLDAVQQMQQENEQQGMQQGQSGDQEQPLLPPSAELKLLRASQIRINQRTELISRAARDHFESDDTTAEALATLAKRQKECAELATEIRERKQMP